MIGDGECNEGSVWEAAMSAPHFKINNLTAILDNNKLQQTGSNMEIMSTESLENKWKSFGWEVLVMMVIILVKFFLHSILKLRSLK